MLYSVGNCTLPIRMMPITQGKGWFVLVISIDSNRFPSELISKIGKQIFNGVTHLILK